ncbi:hypothetical protein [Amantichitinum ursilacus]|uniref:Uncharacterized protein n=1 Tax=Amantichitinum ursilacus TaxID=857265 RepID=A0A0N0GLY8_9NEIS|nr:hypothetical protein [Amantichitinum ursilacus]KPC50417.1 hypothetical protein WG78_17455 [Amantichitinum ursilacus]
MELAHLTRYEINLITRSLAHCLEQLPEKDGANRNDWTALKHLESMFSTIHGEHFVLSGSEKIKPGN